MKRRQYPKSALFLVELLMNLLLFCFLCGCGLMFFLKSHNLTHDATTLHNAVRITSSIASIYENGDGSFSGICNEFEYAQATDTLLHIYLDEKYNPCEQAEAVYRIYVERLDTTPAKIQIEFHDSDGEAAYSIRACSYTPATRDTAKEVAAP